MFAALDRLKVRVHAQQLETEMAENIQNQAKPTEVQTDAGGTISVFTPDVLQ